MFKKTKELIKDYCEEHNKEGIWIPCSKCGATRDSSIEDLGKTFIKAFAFMTIAYFVIALISAAVTVGSVDCLKDINKCHKEYDSYLEKKEN